MYYWIFTTLYVFLTIIIGHGKMSAEIDGWVTANPLTMSVHPNTPNTGEFTVKLKKLTPRFSFDANHINETCHFTLYGKNPT